VVAGVLTPNASPNPGLSQGPSARRWVLRSCRGDDPAVTVVMTVHSSEGTVLIDYQTVTAVELAAARRAGAAS
jgi:hypothetical protein